MEKNKLISGHRYQWPSSPAHGARWINGLFTGEFDKVNGNAIFMARNGERWSVPVDECQPIQKKGI